MRTLSIAYSDDLLVATGQAPEEFEHELWILLAVKLFEVRRLLLGKAAELAGISKRRFLDELGRSGVPVINLDDDQIQDELQDV
jgi:predicted HTH domain antitoxin